MSQRAPSWQGQGDTDGMPGHEKLTESLCIALPHVERGSDEQEATQEMAEGVTPG